MTTFRRHITPPQPRTFGPYDRLLVDPTNGNPIGIANPNANGDHGYFYPIPLSAAQIADAHADILANTYVTYCLDVAPFTRYYSDGSELIQLTNTPGDPYIQQIIYSPFTLTRQMTLYDQTRVYAWPT